MRRPRRGGRPRPETTASAPTTGSSAPSKSRDRRCPPRQRPASRHLACRPSGIINGLHCRTVDAACPYDVAGVSFPGVPARRPRPQRPDRAGAPRTSTRTSRTCSSRRSTRPTRPTTSTEGESVPFDVRTETIKVGRRRSRHHPGPRDAPRTDPQRRRRPAQGQRPGRPRAGPRPREPDSTFDAIFGLNTATDFDDFRAALNDYGAPSQNFVYADVDGHIGYQFPGFVPDPRRRCATRRSPGPRRLVGVARVDGLRSRSTTCPGSSTPSRG